MKKREFSGSPAVALICGAVQTKTVERSKRQKHQTAIHKLSKARLDAGVLLPDSTVGKCYCMFGCGIQKKCFPAFPIVIRYHNTGMMPFFINYICGHEQRFLD